MATANQDLTPERIKLEDLTPASAATLAGELCLIWSGEHSAWWRPGGAGYTVHSEAAGIYTVADAYARTRHCDPSKMIRFERLTRTPPVFGPGSFQSRVQPWMMACFGPEISADVIERNHRFLEEALELVQAKGCTASEAHQLVDYVFGRPAGEPEQEVGGVMVTLAALCLAAGLDMSIAGERELARIWNKVDAIRAKQAAKPRHSPLPQADTAIANPSAWFFARDPDAEWWTGGFVTREAAIADAVEKDAGQPIYVLLAKRQLPSFNIFSAAQIDEQLKEDDAWGEDGWEGGHLDGLHAADLERRLASTLRQWFAECCTLHGAQLDFIEGPTFVQPSEVSE